MAKTDFIVKIQFFWAILAFFKIVQNVLKGSYFIGCSDNL